MKIICRFCPLLFLLFFSTALFGFKEWSDLACLQQSWGKNGEKIVVSTKKIFLEDYPAAYNPSIIKYGEGYLLTFRYSPDLDQQPWISHIGIALLDREFHPLSKPQLLDTCFGSDTPSQAEDGRIFSYGGRLYLIYNDSRDGVFDFLSDQRRDMYIAELSEQNGTFSLKEPLQLINTAEYHTRKIQKNWVPFEWKESLLLTYKLDPHQVLFPNLKTGICLSLAQTAPYLKWKLGEMRPSAPPCKVRGEYLSFFHSPFQTSSPLSEGYQLWHFFIGAYTFSDEFPFEITKISPGPIVGKNFYTHSYRWKVVIYPGGFVVDDDLIYMAYGKNDVEMWVATLSVDALFDSMIPLTTISDSIFTGDLK